MHPMGKVLLSDAIYVFLGGHLPLRLEEKLPNCNMLDVHSGNF